MRNFGLKNLIDETQKKTARMVRDIHEADDSLIRLYHWSNLLSSLIAVMKEEELHDWTLPSPHKP